MEELKKKIEDVLDTIRPALKAEGGNVELVSIDDGVAKLRLKGSCSGCPMSRMTMSYTIERVLKEKVPELKSVEAVK